MGKMTSEARELSATVQALGIPRKSMRVSSSVGKDDFFAHVRIHTKEHEQVALDHIDHLNKRGVTVTSIDYPCGHNTLVGLTHAFGTGEHHSIKSSEACVTCR